MLCVVSVPLLEWALRRLEFERRAHLEVALVGSVEQQRGELGVTERVSKCAAERAAALEGGQCAVLLATIGPVGRRVAHPRALHALRPACVCVCACPARAACPPWPARRMLERAVRVRVRVRVRVLRRGDYLRLQVDDHFYARMGRLPHLLDEGGAAEGYEAWFEQSPEDAEQYTRAQHNGSLATARALLKRVHALRSARALLDVGGGSGALAIELCRSRADARATVLDLPAVIDTAERIVADEDAPVRARITLARGSATARAWAGVTDGAFDAVSFSYLCGSVPADELPGLFERAFDACAPGGTLVVHDFMTANGGATSGPRHAPIWALAHVAVNPLGAALTPARVVGWLDGAGFRAPLVQPMIGELTTLVIARKPLRARPAA